VGSFPLYYVHFSGSPFDWPELRKEEELKSTTVIPEEGLVSEYYEYRQQLDQMATDFRDVITHPTYSLPFLQPGRLVKVKYQKLDFGWGVIINYQKRLPPKVRTINLHCHLILSTRSSDRTDLCPRLRNCHHMNNM